ncbi:MAG: S8 family serine peptidase [Pseudomonadota bacterium]
MTFEIDRANGTFVRLCVATVVAFLLTPFSFAADPLSRTASQNSNQIIVKFNANNASTMGRAAQTRDIQALDRAVTSMLSVNVRHARQIATGGDVFRLERWYSHADLQKRLAKLNADPAVEYAEIDRLMKPMATPNDPRYNEQWHYFENTGGIRLPAAWDSSTGSGVVVAVLDTGYRSHPDLNANLIGGYDMIGDTFVSVDGNGRDSDATDPGDWASAGQCGPGEPASSSSWHGTHVAGTVAAVSNNNVGVAGVAYNAKVVPVRVLGRCGGYTSDIADGIIWAAGGSVSGVPSNANPADVLNMSLGGGGSCSSTTQSAINSARGNGAVVVVAAGNSNVNASNANPANCSGVVTVAATNRSGGKAYYSNFGSLVDVAAPGGDVRGNASNGVLSTLNSGSQGPGSSNYEFYQGTSMAAPHVAGVAALMLAVDGSLTPNEIENTLKNTARSFPASCSQCGSGIVDANAAVDAVSPSNPPPSGGNELTNGVAKTGLSASQGNVLRYTLDVPAGATNLSFSISGGSGDADLYVRFGSEPTTSSYDCRPYLNGNNETCTISNVQAGTYHVMVRAYATFSGVSLVGSFDEPSGGGNSGGSGGVDNLSASRGNWVRYTVEIPSGMSSLVVSISGGSGDADLYLRYGSAPSTSSYNCRPYLNGNNETCTINNPQAGTWHIGIRAYRTFSGVDLTASWQP